MTNVFCFGDSLTRGSWDSQGGWCGRLRQELDKKFIGTKAPKYFQNLFNLGVSSQPIEHLLSRFDNETQARIRENTDNIFIFMVGMVNAGENSATGESTSDKEWLHLLEQLVEKARQYDGKILFIGLPPVDEERVNSEERIARLQRRYFNKRISEIDTLTSQFCQQYDLPKIEINQELLKMDYASLLFDGIHPNDEGHEWIYQQVRVPILELLEK